MSLRVQGGHKVRLEVHSNSSRGAKQCTAEYEVYGFVKTRLNISISDKIRIEVHSGATAGTSQ